MTRWRFSVSFSLVLCVVSGLLLAACGDSTPTASAPATTITTAAATTQVVATTTPVTTQVATTAPVTTQVAPTPTLAATTLAATPTVDVIATVSMSWTATAEASSHSFLQYVRTFNGIANQTSDFVRDSQGNFYVTTGSSTVVKVSPEGKILTTWGGKGQADGQLYCVVTNDADSGYFDGCGIVLDKAENVYITDVENHRIQKFDANGKFLAKWGTKGTGDGQFIGPRGITLDKQGNIYISEGGNHRIQKFDSNGKFLAKWGTMGTGDDQFTGPANLLFDAQGNLYVADIDNPRIQKFDANGQFLAKWGTKGKGEGQFMGPIGMAFDPQGNLLVSDYVGATIQRFTPNGKFLAQAGTGTPGLGNNEFHDPISIVSDGQNLYVSEPFGGLFRQFHFNS